MAIGRLKMKLGKRGKGGAHVDYITREGKFAVKHEQSEKLEAVEEGNMPGFAQGNPRAFFEASDAYERANAKYGYREMELALPRELKPEQRVELMNEWCQQELPNYPYLYAIHNPVATDGGEQPHAHLMFSERENDGIERDEQHFFKRANSKNPDRGGARKTYNMEGTKAERENRLVALRERWQEHVNEHLARADVDARIDMRSNAARGIDRAPQIKMLPSQGAEKARLAVETRAIIKRDAKFQANVKQQATNYLIAKKAEIDALKAAKKAAEAPKANDPLNDPAVKRISADIAVQTRETASARDRSSAASAALFTTELEMRGVGRELKAAQQEHSAAKSATAGAQAELDGIRGLFKGKARKAATASLESAQQQERIANSGLLDVDAKRRALAHKHVEQQRVAEKAKAEADAADASLAKLQQQRTQMIERLSQPAPQKTQGDVWSRQEEEIDDRPDAWSDAENAARRDRSHSNDGPEMG